MPAVSVLIPAYNAEAFLARAIRSVEAQTFRDFEIVVIDDGSTDGTADVAAAFGSVRYVLGSHGGEAAARNRGLEEAESELVAFVDADDEWLPEKLTRQVAFMEKLGSSFSYTDSYLVTGGRRVRYSTLGRPRNGQILMSLIDDWLDQAFLIPTEVMASRTLLQSAGGFEEGLPTPGHVDYGLWLKLALRGTRFDYLDDPLALYYRGHPSVASDAVEMVERYRVALQYFATAYDFPAEGQTRIERALARSHTTLAVELAKRRRWREAVSQLRWSSVPDLARKGRLFASRRTGRLRASGRRRGSVVNVLFFTSWYPTSDFTYGGVFVREHAKAVREAGHRIVVIHLAGPRPDLDAGVWKMEEELDPSLVGRDRGVPRIPPSVGVRSASYPLYLWSAMRAYRRLLGSGFRPNVIHAHVYGAGVPAAIVAGRSNSRSS